MTKGDNESWVGSLRALLEGGADVNAELRVYDRGSKTGRDGGNIDVLATALWRVNEDSAVGRLLLEYGAKDSQDVISLRAHRARRREEEYAMRMYSMYV